MPPADGACAENYVSKADAYAAARMPVAFLNLDVQANARLMVGCLHRISEYAILRVYQT